MTLTYTVGDSLYLNITNRCSCSCIFCIRLDHDSVGSADTLWLDRDPGAQDVIDELKQRDLAGYQEVVFCGYGEPTENFEVLLAVCDYLRQQAPTLPIRLNTNGLGRLYNEKDIVPLLKGRLDSISISLNAPDAARYLEVTQPAYGAGSFEAMLEFAKDCKDAIPHVAFTVVDVLQPGEVERCRQLAEELGIPLRVRVKA